MGAVRRAGCALLISLVFASPASARVGFYSAAFTWPADGVVTSPFGPRAEGFHPGVDIGVLRDLTVRSASPGRVVTTGEQAGYDGYGNVVVVDIGGGFTILYGHLTRPLVRPGAFVRAGEVIGVAGCTGWCTGTHLHFELRNHGIPMDPMTLLGASPFGAY